MEKADALRKIQRCLALSKSSDMHEAARALHQAQALMEKFGFDDPDLLQFEIKRHWVQGRAASRPPGYEVMLANVIGDAFGCKLIFLRQGKCGKVVGGYEFMGHGASAEVAAYTFDVFAKQLAIARAQYTKDKLGRYKKNKVAAADTFCTGWVCAVANGVKPARISEEAGDALALYYETNFPSLPQLKSSDRQVTKNIDADSHMYHGYASGQKAKVNRGLSDTKPQPRLIGM